MLAASDMAPVVAAFRPLWQAQLSELAKWWREVALDPGGGFYGEVGVDNQPVPGAPRGLIHTARIVYFFSRYARHTGDLQAAAAAHHAYAYLKVFSDTANGGYVWSLEADGRKRDGRKHLYAQAFAVYGLTAYYQLTGRPQVLTEALGLFQLIETHGWDDNWGGYLEGFSQSWQPLDDMRLCAAAPQAAKTMNTHLHLLEAYSALALTSGAAAVHTSLRHLLEIFCERIVDGTRGHLRMFMGADWQDKSECVSFGHDIEASWLIAQALQVVGQEQRYAHLPQQLAEVSLNEAWSPHGGIRNERHIHTGVYCEARTWWAQSEALIGYLHAWRRSGDDRFAQRALAIWQFIEVEHKDSQLGEWFWFARQDMHGQIDADALARNYKSGFWKCPYHNGRALMEACELLSDY